jgi:hypothetical protein
MSVKPAAVSSVLPPVLRDQGKRPPDSNRFAPLAGRDRVNSVSGSLPPPSPATKRPPEDQIGPTGNGKNMRMDPSRVFSVMEGVEKMMAKGRDDILRARTALANDKEMSASSKEVLGGLISSNENMADAFELLASIVVDISTKAGTVTTNPNMARGNYAAAAGGPKAKPIVNQEEVRKKKFVQAVKEAEKSVLVFGLDLGKVQIMNTATISRNVTQDIVRKAAVTENKTDGRPGEETVALLEDTLSMVTSMDFFGKVTKPFNNKRDVNDVNNGKFCTLPVKLNFKNKEAKARAETILRRHCGISGSTPYPQKLRKLIGKTLADERAKNPQCFIQVRVDSDNLALKVSKRNDKKEWVNNYISIDLPAEVMDLGTVSNDTNMDTSPSQASL